MEKLDLESGENCPELVFISKKMLIREPEFGGITLQSEKEIFFTSTKKQLVREKETQTELDDENVNVLKKRLKIWKG